MTYISTEELLRMLFLIRKRPGMYLYPLSLASLGNFISGYRLSCMLNQIKQDKYDFLTEFRYWLQEQYCMEHTNQYPWWGIILQNVSSDGIEAIEEFYIMLDKFIDEKKISGPNTSEIPDIHKVDSILVRINYLIEVDNDKTVKKILQEENFLEDDILIDDRHSALWQSTNKIFLNTQFMNCGKCAKCHGWTTDREKPDWIDGLCNGATVDGKLLCDECLPKGHRWAF